MTLRGWALFLPAVALFGNAVPLPADAARPAAGENVRLDREFGRIPVAFEENRGQTDPAVRFLARADGFVLFLTDSGAVVKFPARRGEAPAGEVSLRLAFERSAAGTRPVGVDRLPRTSNYFIGNDPARWRTGVPSFAKVRYRDIYPGVDLFYRGERRQLEFDLIVAPGADPRRIVLDVDGARRASRDPDGTLRLATQDGELRLHRPAIYQESGGARRKIAGDYVLLSGGEGRRRVGLRVGAYDSRSPLIVDPELTYSTYLGGGNDDFATGIAADASGNAYVTGITESAQFPGVGNGSLQPTPHGDFDVFLTKIDPAGTAIVYSTFLGGSDGEDGGTVAVDAAGNAYVVGSTYSTDFPILHALQAHNAGIADAFVAKIDPAGTALVYSTYLGGSDYDFGDAIAIDPSGNAYLTGDTRSTNFPGTAASPIQSSVAPGGNYHGWVTKIAAAGNAIVFSTYLGGNGTDDGYGIAVDGSRNVYVSGQTSSPNFVGASGGPIQASIGGSLDAFVTKIDASGTAIVYSTFLGGNGEDWGYEIALDSSRNAYVTGGTASSDFPKASASAIQSHYAGGGEDAFVAKINAAGTAIVYSTYLGGSGDDSGVGIGVDSSGTAYVAGSTASSGFPGTGGSPIQAARAGGFDVFVTAINPAGSAILFSTYLGGGGGDFAGWLALDPARNVYIAGQSASTNLHGASESPIQPHFGGGSDQGDAFAAKIATVACSGGGGERPCILPVSAPLPKKVRPRP